MNTIKRICVVAIALATISTAAMAQFRIGPRVGINVNSLKLNKELVAGDNMAGFTGGLQAEFTIPLVNLAFDASVMYTRHNTKDIEIEGGKLKRDYISIPVNLKYKIGLPAVGKIISPYIFTGPEFAFLCSKQAITDAWEQKKVDIAWNVGLGLQLFTHLQVGASYVFGLTKMVETFSHYNGAPLDGKNKYWTVTAAWLF